MSDWIEIDAFDHSELDGTNHAYYRGTVEIDPLAWSHWTEFVDSWMPKVIEEYGEIVTRHDVLVICDNETRLLAEMKSSEGRNALIEGIVPYRGCWRWVKRSPYLPKWHSSAAKDVQP